MTKNIKQALNSAFRKVPVAGEDINKFKEYLTALLKITDNKINEHEEHHRNNLRDFFKQIFAIDNFNCYLNTKNRNDLVIHNGNQDSPVGVIIETKKPDDSTEMITLDKFNVKSLQQLLFYYLQEAVEENNHKLKHLIITDIYNWFIFDATLFQRLFSQNKPLIQDFKEFQEGRLPSKNRPFFYEHIASKYIAQWEDELKNNCIYFNLKESENKLQYNQDIESDLSLIPLYKFLSPKHLLKLPFINDSNSLDKDFYNELLYIIGLEEVGDNKKLIQRLPSNNRQEGSLLENVIYHLELYNKLSNLTNLDKFGTKYEEQIFGVALELVITWINRILFLKLLEAQLISYNNDDKNFAFLHREKIANFNDLDTLFFGVLAKRNDERNPKIKEKLKENIPYLNSSLFEVTELENQTLFIANLNNDYELPLFRTTVLKNNQGSRKTGELNTLTYLFDFLSAYNFSSEGKEEIQAERKNLINASVLGLIFEKINGYKDGSYFTPSFITMYMCRESITRAIIEKFNQLKNWNCTDIEELENRIDYADKEVRKEANDIINSIKICDPAVGSGHFLVSALNEIIALKRKLRVLQDKKGKTIREYIEVENDELIIKDENGDLYSYKPNSPDSQRIQETLFDEKKTIIENCLFGVDINLNSVNICRLRLWIELLKNAYYHPDTKELETLPNIDINIKCGNSLISRFDLNSDLSLALKKINLTIADYQQAIKTYHNPQSRQEKEEIVKLIKQIKDNFNTLITGNTPLEKKLREKESQLYQLQNQTSLLPESDDDKKARETTEKSLNNEINQLKKEIEDEINNIIYRNAFEWRFEFPEVLNEKGDFIGFDLIIGNPPYISANSGEEILELRQKILQSNRYKTLWEKWDLYVAFIEQSFQLIKNRGLCSLIIPYPYLNQNYAKLSREFIIKENTLLEIVNLHSIKVFETATVNNCIVFGKKEYKGDYKIKVSLPEDYKINKTFYVDKDNILTTNSVIELETRKTFNFSQEQFKNLGDLCFISVGMVLNADEKRVKGAFKKKDLISDTQSRIHQKQYIEAKNIDSYQINLIRFLEWNTNRVPNLIRRPTFPELYQNEKILINKIGKIKATYDNNNLFCDQTIRIAVLWYNLIGVQNKSIDNNVKKFSNYSRQQLEQFSTQINIKFILGILNSKLGNYLLDNIRGVGNIDLNPDYLKNIPIPYVPLEQQKTIINLVDEILEIKRKKPQTKTNNKEEEIDELVYKLYGLTKEEIKIIEGHQ